MKIIHIFIPHFCSSHSWTCLSNEGSSSICPYLLLFPDCPVMNLLRKRPPCVLIMVMYVLNFFAQGETHPVSEETLTESNISALL